tara:strand:+ start:106 stop:294 length:189 start_codon:yes stop_codon:yes gene_type:complete
MIENKDSIDMWINTCKGMSKSVLITAEQNNVDKLLQMLKLFRRATKKLEIIIEMSKEERFTA